MHHDTPDHEDYGYSDLAMQHASLSRVLSLFRPYRGRIACVGLLMAVASAVGLVGPFLLRAIIDTALPQRDLSLLVWLAAGMVAVALASSGIAALQVILSSRIGQAILHDLRVRLYSHLQSLSLRFFTGTRVGEVQSRIASDIAGLQSLVTDTANELGRSLSSVLMTAVAIALLDWRLALFVLLIVPGTMLISSRVARMREALTYAQQARAADMSAAVQETLSISGIILARTMGRGSHLSQRFARISRDLAKLEVKSHTAGEWQWSLISFSLAVLPAMTLLAGGVLIQTDNPVTIGTLVAMIALQEQLLWPFEQLLEIGRDMRKTRALFARIFEYLDKPVEITERADPVSVPRTEMRGEVRLDHVSFAYREGNRPAVHDLNLTIAAGTHVAIVGPTGSGKTTLGYLLARLYDVDSGAIRFDGVDLRDLSFQSLSDMLGVVSQEPYLLHTSVAENLRFAKSDATEAELVEAAKIAQIHDHIASLPQGYDTLVGEGGYRFSGGEKQRLVLARTILRNPPILLLDEATSALDTRTERAMSIALDKMSKGRTTITIAHRLSTIRRADLIVVMQAGRIVEQGMHDELAASGGLYAGLLRGA
ncbi:MULTISPECIES: ABC transporter ATP-binding protein [unclassified Rhizobium]|uniref:ABC transporter ATP-binding protein n=1 Tax=unclassified Rhizobium TaxID=2613769 RepID=UPI000EAA7040|nr:MULTISPECIES: ABC transporter ATP-binding protein [unclassified Rhizobium]AYG68538.1 ABC transporter ATP-binding protein [Rhizobium sp. CCGE531]AYG74922.1 ABC transporter ATP-binding protein [Rhizobium sp. CCGE532]